MEIINIIIEIIPYLLSIAVASICLYVSYRLLFNLYAGIREYMTVREFTNKKRLLLDIFIILGFIAFDWQFLENNIAWIGCLVGLFLFIVGFLIGRIPMEIKYNKISKSRKTIKTVTELGFDIEFGEKTISYQWKNIETISLKIKENSLQEITLFIKFHNGIKLSLDENCPVFYFLLKNIPKGYPTMDYDFIKEFFNNLTTCPFCGLIAFEDFSWCLHCACDAKNDIREEQLEIFATMDKNEKFSDFKINNKTFARDEKWKPIVTKQEVLQYSEKNIWE